MGECVGLADVAFTEAQRQRVAACAVDLEAIDANFSATQARCEELPVPCTGHGACDSNEECACDAGWVGTKCELAPTCRYWNATEGGWATDEPSDAAADGDGPLAAGRERADAGALRRRALRVRVARRRQARRDRRRRGPRVAAAAARREGAVTKTKKQIGYL